MTIALIEISEHLLRCVLEEQAILLDWILETEVLVLAAGFHTAIDRMSREIFSYWVLGAAENDSPLKENVLHNRSWQ